MKKLITLLSLTFFTAAVFAQDKIYKIKGPVINAKVIEIGTDEIKYTLQGSTDGPVYVVDKSNLSKIEYADGRVENFQRSYKDPQNYDGQLTKAIKIDFLAPLLGYSHISFEKSISPLKSFEVGVGIIGAGKNDQVGNYYINGEYRPYKRNAGGVFFDAGYKFNKLPNFFNKGMRMTHVMQGTYIKPTALVGFYSDNALNYKNQEPVVERRKNVFGAILLDFGRQWVFGDKFLVDMHFGFGYAFDNSKQDDSDPYYSDYVDNHFAIQKAGPGANLGIGLGIKVGMLLK